MAAHAEAAGWVYAPEEQPCTSACADHGGCVSPAPWPIPSRSEMEAASGTTCKTYETGGSYLNPMVDHKGDCYYKGEGRCSGTTGNRRLCWCNGGAPSPPPVADRNRYILSILLGTCALLVAVAAATARTPDPRSRRLIVGVPMAILAALCYAFGIISMSTIQDSDDHDQAYGAAALVCAFAGLIGTVCARRNGVLHGAKNKFAAGMTLVYIGAIVFVVVEAFELPGEGLASDTGERVFSSVTFVCTCLVLCCFLRTHYTERTTEDSLREQLRAVESQAASAELARQASRSRHAAQMDDGHQTAAAHAAQKKAAEDQTKAESAAREATQALGRSEAERKRLARQLAEANRGLGVSTGNVAVWECDVDGKWVPYSAETATVLEAGFTTKRTDLTFTYRTHTYKLDTTSALMHQTNMSTNAKRQVHRVLERDRIPGAASWSAQPSDQNCVLVQVNSATAEYTSVLGLLRATIPSAQMIRLDRIQNVLLWDYYCTRKARMRKVNGAEPNEVSVWHGTRSHDPKLVYEDAQDGFMMQYCESGMWGKGIYFAERASYSDNYVHRNAQGQKLVMLTKLLAGEEQHIMPNDRSLRFPPKKPNGARFDTVTGDTGGSKVYVVYENGRAYPEYLVTYT